MTLRERQINLLGGMMSTEKGRDHGDILGDQWKVLIYDHDCKDIISPLMNVGALRQKGITLHLGLHSEREAIPDAPAVYFVRPTEENINKIADDCSKRLYRSVYLHFVSRIDRHLLEKLAHDLVTSNSVSMIAKIYDEYLDLISLESSLFTLNMRNSFVAYNDPSMTEIAIKGFVSKMTMGLLSLTRVLGVLPIIRAPPGGVAEMLAQDFNATLRENLTARGSSSSSSTSGGGGGGGGGNNLFTDCIMSDRARPLLLIFDRSADLTAPLMHSSTYLSLVDDLLDYRLNRVSVEIPSKDGGGSKKRTYDLNSHSDSFFGRYASAVFPDAVEANQKELAEVSQKEAEIRSRPGQTGAAAAIAGLDAGGKDLMEALGSLPDILARKANLEAHTNILQAVMKSVASREIPTYFEMEQAILASGRVDKAGAIALLKDTAKGRIQDKARLLLIISLTLQDASARSSQDEYNAAFQHGCADPATAAATDSTSVVATETTTAGLTVEAVLAAVSFIRRLSSLQSNSYGGFGGSGSGPASSSGGGGGAYFSSFLSTAQTHATSLTTSLIAKASALFTKFAPLYYSRVVDSLAEGRSCTEDDTFCTLDPKLRAGEMPHVDARGQKYSEAIVFVVGGGGYVEYFNLMELLRQKQTTAGAALKSIIYGSTELVNGDSFLQQLVTLGAMK